MPKGKPISQEIKRRAVKAMKAPGANIATVAADLKTSVSNVRRWAGKARKKRGKKAGKPNGMGRKPTNVVSLLEAEEKRLVKQLGAVRTAIRLLKD